GRSKQKPTQAVANNTAKPTPAPAGTGPPDRSPKPARTRARNKQARQAAQTHKGPAERRREDYGQAEKSAKPADKNASVLNFAIWSESPDRVLKDVAEGRSKQKPTQAVAANTGKPAPAPAGTRPTDSSPNQERARALIKQARQAVQTGK